MVTESIIGRSRSVCAMSLNSWTIVPVVLMVSFPLRSLESVPVIFCSSLEIQISICMFHGEKRRKMVR